MLFQHIGKSRAPARVWEKLRCRVPAISKAGPIILTKSPPGQARARVTRRVDVVM